MTRIYYIYHLPGKKVGCTSNMERRFKEYRLQGYRGPIHILEKFSGSITEAGNREWRYANKFGYKLGWHYSLTYAKRALKAKIQTGQYKVNPGRIKFR
jgi:hypothetical protein